MKSKEIVKLIREDKLVEAKAVFNKLMTEKTSKFINEKREEIAKTFFKQK